MTPAHIAAANGSVSVIRELVRFSKGFIASTKNKGGHRDLVNILLEAGTPAEAENDDGFTALHLAAKAGYVDVLDALKSHVDLKQPSTVTGLTALHVAAQCGQIDFVREMLTHVDASLLSARPCNASSSTEYGLTPLHLASQHGHENLVRLLLNCSGVQVDVATAVNNTLPIHLTAQNGHANVLSLLLSKSSAQINKKDGKGRSALHLAASYGHYEMVALLLAQGATINAVDLMLNSPLHFAAKSGHLEVCRLLVSSGASTVNETQDCATPLHLAAEFNHPKVVSFLLTKDHDTDTLLSDSAFLLHLVLCSKQCNHKAIDEFILLSKAPAVTAAKISGRLNHVAVQEKERTRDLLNAASYCEEMCSDLVALAAYEHGADQLLRAVDSQGVRFLDILIKANQKEVIAHPSVQSYLSDLWRGNLDWSATKYSIAFLLSIVFPPLWMIVSLPIGAFSRINMTPSIKFMVSLISYIWLVVFFILTSVSPPDPLCLRTGLDPTWYELLLLVWLTGLLVTELVNPGNSGDLAMLKLIMLFLSTVAILIHLIAFALDTGSRLEALYIRNMLLSLATFMGITAALDFLTFHHLFGPWTIVIRELLTDMLRFIIILILFSLGFACLLSSAFLPIYTTDYTGHNPWLFLVLLYFSMFGLVSPDDLPDPSLSPNYAKTIATVIFTFFLLIINVVLLNLLIAMMTETYVDIKDRSDTEWKFGRAKLIQNMKKNVPTPSPLILVTQAIYQINFIYHFVRGLPPPKQVEDVDNLLGSQIRRGRKDSVMIKSNAFVGNNVSVADAVDWATIVDKYEQMHSNGSEDAEKEEKF